jgi:hypothetical protein
MSESFETNRQEAQRSGPTQIPVLFFWPLWVMPIVVLGGIFLATYAPHPIESFYIDKGLPFLLSFWIGLGFTYTWRYIRLSMPRESFTPAMVAAVGILSALVILSMLGGISILWEDPWLFGVAVAPGFSLARPLIKRWLLGAGAASSTDSAD